MCETCIFRPGNLMQLEPGRRESLERQAVRRDGCIPCHETLDGPRVICRGFFDRHKDDVVGLRLAQVFKKLEFV